MFSPPVEKVLHFLTELFEASCGYSAPNTARSALSTFIVFHSRPTFPKYTEIWDVNVVLSYLKTLSPVAKLSQRIQRIQLLDLLAGRAISRNPLQTPRLGRITIKLRLPGKSRLIFAN